MSDKKVAQPELTRGLGTEIVANVVGGVGTVGTVALVKQGLAKLGTGKKDQPKK